MVKSGRCILETFDFEMICLEVIVTIILCCIQYGELLMHTSKLCVAKNMPCEFQLHDHESISSCQMTYYMLNSTKCRDLQFDDTSPKSNLGKTSLKTYYYTENTHFQTAFNVTFENIIWKHLKFRFMQEDDSMKNTCREFNVSSTKAIKTLFYDCLWSYQDYEGKIFTFEYEARNDFTKDYKKFKFKVPFDSNINMKQANSTTWEIFLYVEILPTAFGPTKFILHWQAMPKIYNIKSYMVSVWSDSELVEYVKINDTALEYEDLTYTYMAWYGTIQMGVQPVLNYRNQEIFISRTPVFNLGGRYTKELLVGIVVTAVIVPAFFFILFLLRIRIFNSMQRIMNKTPKLLIIYAPSLSTHVDVVFLLVDYLKTICNIDVMLDQHHISRTPSKNPYKWGNDAFRVADFVMVVSSPFYKTLRCTDVLYQTDTFLLKLLPGWIGDKNSKAQYFTLKLPYTTEKDIPSEAINFQRFSFPKDLDKMVQYLHSGQKIPKFCCIPIQGGKKDYEKYGRKVKDGIERAQNDIKNNGRKYNEKSKQMLDSTGSFDIVADMKETNLGETGEWHNLKEVLQLEAEKESYRYSINVNSMLGVEDSESSVSSELHSLISDQTFDISNLSNI